MPVINRKRRAQAEPEASPAPTRRRTSPSPSTSGDSADPDANGDTQATNGEQMVKNLVRLALASEYSRTPIRRSDITSKVLPPGASRRFKEVFAQANDHLRTIFGMELTELPQKDKVTVSQKRAAQRSGTQSQTSASNRAYILTSILPPAYRVPTILPPAQIPSASAEGSYVGLTTFVIGLIYLSPGQMLSESRLEKHLKRMNADNYVFPGEKTENVLKRMMKEGYIVKIKERDQGGEETVDFLIGPRGRVEVGERGVAGMVRGVYQKRDAEAEELERRLVRSLGEGVAVGKRRVGEGEMEEEEEEEGGEAGGSGRASRRSSTGRSGRRSQRRRRTRDEEEEEEEEEDSD